MGKRAGGALAPSGRPRQSGRVPEREARAVKEDAVRWSDFEVGQSATFSKTLTETDVVLYAGVTGDLNPAHVDREFAARTFFGERVAHGLLTAGLVSAVLGTRLPGPGCVFVSFACRFVRPVRLGDTITARAEIVDRLEEKRHLRLETSCENQAGERVLEGEALVLIPEPRS